MGKLKGVGQLAIAKMNELRIHTIADLQLHVCHRGKVILALALTLALALALASGSKSGSVSGSEFLDERSRETDEGVSE